MTSGPSGGEIARPAPRREASLLALALRVVRGELTEEEALEIIRRSAPRDEAGPSDK